MSLDLSVLEQLKQDFGDDDFEGLLDQIVNDAVNLMSCLETAAENDDIPATRRAAHALRGLCGQFGFLDAARALEKVEDGPEAAVNRDAVEVLAECTRVLVVIREKYDIAWKN